MTETNYPLPINHIEWNGRKQQPFVAGTGYSVAFIIALLNRSGWSVEEVTQDYELTPAQIYAACSYYHDHHDEIEAILNSSANDIGRPVSDLSIQNPVIID